MPLFRRKSGDEFPLPSDYRPVDYTSIPEAETNRPSTRAKLLIGLGAILLIGSIIAVAVLLFGGGGDPPRSTPTPGKVYNFSLRRAELEEDSGELIVTITSAPTDLDEGTVVSATLLEDGEPFELWDTSAATSTVESGRVEWSIPVLENAPVATRDLAYTVVAMAMLDTQVVSASRELRVLSSAQALFYGKRDEPSATPDLPPTATLEPGVTPDPPTPVPPTPEPGPFDTVAQTAGTLVLSPYTSSEQRGSLAAGEEVKVVAKLFDRDWYLVAAGTKSGWVQGSVLQLAGSNIPLAGGPGNQAVVFNGGNIRTVAGTGSVVGQLQAGQTVKLVERSGDDNWMKVEAPGGNGWVSMSLLTINPQVLQAVPVAP